MATKQALVKVNRWSGSQHPTLSNITRIMQKDGMRPYKWQTQPNQRFAVRSHGYTKVLFVVDGTIDILLPGTNQQTRLRAGDRIEIPPRVRHGGITGQNGAVCLEAVYNPQ